MKKLLVVFAATALVATSAQAAPGFGGSFAVSSDGASASAERQDGGFFGLFLQLVRFGNVVSAPTGGAGDSADPRTKQAQCPEEKATEARTAEKDAQSKTSKNQGPEPLFLAF
jgi:predicted Rdx family selenoprotein